VSNPIEEGRVPLIPSSSIRSSNIVPDESHVTPSQLHLFPTEEQSHPELSFEPILEPCTKSHKNVSSSLLYWAPVVDSKQKKTLRITEIIAREHFQWVPMDLLCSFRTSSSAYEC